MQTETSKIQIDSTCYANKQTEKMSKDVSRAVTSRPIDPSHHHLHTQKKKYLISFDNYQQ